MKANPFSIFHVFSMECQYTIPMFQRHYVWSLDQQWKPLWEDIEAKATEPTSFEIAKKIWPYPAKNETSDGSPPSRG
jgi:uncharacterized protein with ParB-like and HNH nuclease domain